MTMTEWPTVSQIISVMEAKDYKVFRNARGHDLNIVGIRTADLAPNTFNDWLTVFYTFEKVWNYFAFLLTLCERAKEKFGNSFSCTLLEEADFEA